MRFNLVAGNWKMNTSLPEAIALTTALYHELQAKELPENLRVVICPPMPYLLAIRDLLSYLEDDKIYLGAQNCHHQDYGAFTGEVSAEMLAAMYIDYVIIGHSERRKYANENDDLLKEKVNAALANELQVIFCCGESLAVREENTHFTWVANQIKNALFHLTAEQFENVVIAYEPIWAIGTGKTASPEQAEAMHAHIRDLIADKYGSDFADESSILYGGSCKPSNAAELFSQQNVDGGLIGGASLKAKDFSAIIASF